jgi:3-oxoacyl-[acyl-carrier protein] reductase
VPPVASARATAERLVADGATVIAVDRDQDRLEVTAKELGPSVCPLRADVADARDWERMLAVALEETGRLDLLVNNAGIEGPHHQPGRLPGGGLPAGARHQRRGRVPRHEDLRAALGASGRGSIVNVASVSGLGRASRRSWATSRASTPSSG